MFRAQRRLKLRDKMDLDNIKIILLGHVEIVRNSSKMKGIKFNFKNPCK